MMTGHRRRARAAVVRARPPVCALSAGRSPRPYLMGRITGVCSGPAARPALVITAARPAFSRAAYHARPADIGNQGVMYRADLPDI